MSYYPDSDIESKGGLDYTYDPNHWHAVQGVIELMFGSTVHSYGYDANGNMTSRDGDSLTYDAENRLVEVNNGATARFVYDRDGNRVKATLGSTTIVYVGITTSRKGAPFASRGKAFPASSSIAGEFSLPKVRCHRIRLRGMPCPYAGAGA